jgi:hypothetical protein
MAKAHSEKKWIEEEFGEVRLGDRRKEKRLKKIAESMASCPEGSILEAAGDWAGAKGAYRLLDSDIEPGRLMAGHVEQTLRRMGAKAVSLAVQDTTALNFTSHRAMEGLGKIGANSGGAQGFFCHCTLMVDEQGYALGLLAAETYVRAEQVLKAKRGPQAQERESGRWLRSLDACQEAASRQRATRIVNIGDREADFYEFAAHAAERAPDVGYLVRAAYDRQSAEGLPSLFERVGRQESSGSFAVQAPRKAGEKAREALLEIRFCAVELRAPAHWKKEHQQSAPLALWMVEAREEQKQKGKQKEAVCWRLLTNLPVGSFKDAVEKVQWYCRRWSIEVFHKVLKSGCRIERRQLETRERMERVLMLDLVMAWRVLYLMGLGRGTPEASAQELLSQSQWKALHCFENKTAKAPAKPPSIGEAMRSIAKLGGFPARKGDGNPGPIVLWRGLSRLEDITSAYLIFNKPTCG